MTAERRPPAYIEQPAAPPGGARPHLRKSGPWRRWPLHVRPTMPSVPNSLSPCCQSSQMTCRNRYPAAFHGREAKLGPEHLHTIDSLRELVRLYECWRKPDEAEKWRAKLPPREAAEEGHDTTHFAVAIRGETGQFLPACPYNATTTRSPVICQSRGNTRSISALTETTLARLQIVEPFQ